MNIFLISNMFPSADSPGYGSFVKNVMEGLSRHGVTTVKKAVIDGKPQSKSGKLKKYFKFYKDIVGGFFSKYDAIYIHFPNHAIPLLNILYKFRQPQIHINFHGEDLLYKKGGYTGKIGEATERFCRKYASSIIVPSEYFKSLVEKRNLLPSSKIFVSPSGGINPDFFHPSKRENVDSGNVAESERPIHLGYVGRLDPGKGILEFIDTLTELQKRDIPFKATIIGYGTLHSQVEDLISNRNLSDKTELINGVSQKELGKYYNSFDLLVFLSSRESESLGLTGIESMACGTPIIGSNIGGIASYLKDGINGIMVKLPISPAQVADAIIRYKNLNPSQLEIMRNNCIATGSRYYNDTVCQSLAAHFKE